MVNFECPTGAQARHRRRKSDRCRGLDLLYSLYNLAVILPRISTTPLVFICYTESCGAHSAASRVLTDSSPGSTAHSVTDSLTLVARLDRSFSD